MGSRKEYLRVKFSGNYDQNIQQENNETAIFGMVNELMELYNSQQGVAIIQEGLTRTER